MKWRLFKRKLGNTNGLFTGHFVEVKSFYALEFDLIPCVSFIGELDISKVFALVKENYKTDITQIYQHAYYDHEQGKMLFNDTIFVLTSNRMIHLDSNYCQVLHTTSQYGWANELIREIASFKHVAEPVKQNRVIGFARQTDTN